MTHRDVDIPLNQKANESARTRSYFKKWTDQRNCTDRKNIICISADFLSTVKTSCDIERTSAVNLFPIWRHDDQTDGGISTTSFLDLSGTCEDNACQELWRTLWKDTRNHPFYFRFLSQWRLNPLESTSLETSSSHTCVRFTLSAKNKKISFGIPINSEDVFCLISVNPFPWIFWLSENIQISQSNASTGNEDI